MKCFLNFFSVSLAFFDPVAPPECPRAQDLGKIRKGREKKEAAGVRKISGKISRLMKKRQRGILVLFCLSLLPKGRAKEKNDVPSGKKRVHKIEAFNDIKRDQKAHECQERAKGFT